MPSGAGAGPLSGSAPTGAAGSALPGNDALAAAARRRQRCEAALRLAIGTPEGPYASFGARLESGIDMPSLEVDAARAHETIAALRNDPELAFDQLSYVTATDEWPDTPRFRVIWLLQSIRHRWRARVHTRVPDSETPSVESVVDLYLGAAWMEREVWDMFGIRFDGHPDLRRILMPEGYGHHPLRKDFPMEGIVPDRQYREWERASRDLPEDGAGA